jgi:hypothetical protein
MARREWTIDVGGVPHSVELEHGQMSSRRVIRVDGQVVAEAKGKFIDWGSDHPVTIAGSQYVIAIRSNGFSYRYDLVPGEARSNGGAVSNGQLATSVLPASGIGAAPTLPRKHPWDSVPGWGWPFFFACIALVAVGGAIGGAIGFGAAMLCGGIAGKPARSVGVRVVLCTGVVIGAWLLVFVFTGAIYALIS